MNRLGFLAALGGAVAAVVAAPRVLLHQAGWARSASTAAPLTPQSLNEAYAMMARQGSTPHTLVVSPKLVKVAEEILGSRYTPYHVPLKEGDEPHDEDYWGCAREHIYDPWEGVGIRVSDNMPKEIEWGLDGYGAFYYPAPVKGA